MSEPTFLLTPIGYVHSSWNLQDDLDAADGAAFVDIKPVMAEFLPRGEIRQPRWSIGLMRRYWRAGAEPASANHGIVDQR